jgi:DNA-binding IclR family transcriptional regulator
LSTTLRKCLTVLEEIANSDAPRGISELAREVNLNKSAVQRIVQTLVEEGYIEKTTDTSRYKPTLRLWELGSSLIARNEPRRLIRPVLSYASKISGFTCYLAWADYPDVIYLDKVEGEHGRSNSSDPGQRLPMYLTASGRAILAFYDENSIKQVLAGASGKDEGLEMPTDQVYKELLAVRSRMYAVTERGSALRIASIAAPIWSAGPLPVASIVLTSDSVSMPKSDYDRVANIVLNAASQATLVLGGSVPVGVFEAP